MDVGYFENLQDTAKLSRKRKHAVSVSLKAKARAAFEW